MNNRLLMPALSIALALSTFGCISADESGAAADSEDVREATEALTVGHRWPANGTAVDVEGDADGTLVGGAGYGPGKMGLAFKFDGGPSTAVTFGTSAGNFGAASFRLSFWVKMGASVTAGLLSKRSECGHGSFLDIRFLDALTAGGVPGDIPGTIQYEIDDGTPGGYIYLNGKRVIDDGKFHHVVLVRRGVRLTARVDGALDVTGTTGHVVDLANAAPFTAGRSPCAGLGDTTEYFVGLIDDIKMRTGNSPNQGAALLPGSPAQTAQDDLDDDEGDVL